MSTNSTWKKISEEAVKHGSFKYLRRRFVMPSGAIEDTEVRDFVGAVHVLALTTDKKVILLKQFRVGPEQVLLNVPGGGMEAGETPEQATARELREETGYQAESLQLVNTSWLGAYETAKKHILVALNCHKIAEPDPGDEEFMGVEFLSLEEFKQHLESGNLTHSDLSCGLAGLQYLKQINLI